MKPANPDDQTRAGSSPAPDSWERDVMEKLVMASVTEARRSRRWGIFFKSLFFGYLLVFLGLLMVDVWTEDGMRKESHTALVEIDGLIASADLGVDADQVVDGLRAAYKDKHTKGIILRINSPGGSPVQADDINAEIRRLRDKHPDIPVYAVVSDVCASGGYYVAAAADAIYANPSSIVGSIGVRMDQFGFVEAMEKLGIERRLLTAGEHKGALDPFLPLDGEEQAHAQQVLDRIHQQFIKVVKEGRGERLGDTPDLFSGRYWTGQQSLELGLIDGFGDMRYVARELVGEKKIVDFTVEEDVWERFANRLGAGAGAALARLFGVQDGPGIR